MSIYLNILVILFAVIAFLILYYTSLRKDRKSQDYQLPFREARTEYETGEEIGVDKTIMENNSQDNLSKKTQFQKKSSLEREKNTTLKKPTKRDEINEDLYPLKGNYNKTFIRIFSRDPYYLFTYWEVREEDFYNNAPILRLFNLKENKYYDIEINHHSRNWYLHSEPNNIYRVSIGYIKEGCFYPLASSDSVQTPLNRPSDIIDEHWMTIEELSQYSFRIEMDSLSLVKNIEGRKIEEELEADSLTIVQR